MTSISSALNNGAHLRRAQYARWARLLDTILPTPDAGRLVCVAEVDRRSLSLIEGGLTDVGLTPVITEQQDATGESSFRVLVEASDAELARAVAAGA